MTIDDDNSDTNAQEPKRNESTPQAKPPQPFAKGKPAAKPAPAAVTDLSAEIERAVEREPRDWVRCVRVFSDFYRCNWWSRRGPAHEGAGFDLAGLVTDHVRKSRFLQATMRDGELVIAEVKGN